MKKIDIKINSINQAFILIKNKSNRIIYKGYYNHININLEKNSIYKIYVCTIYRIYLIPIYTNKNFYVINISKYNLKKFILTDSFYHNLPITKGVIKLNAT